MGVRMLSADKGGKLFDVQKYFKDNKTPSLLHRHYHK